MFGLSKEELQLLRERIQNALNATGEDLPLREKLAHIYVAGLRDKTAEQGLLMADQVIRTVEEFTVNFHAATEDFDSWFDGEIEGALDSKELPERCRILFQLANALDASCAELMREDMASAGIDADDIIDELSGKQLSGEVGEGLYETLLTRLRASVATSFSGSVAIRCLKDVLDTPEDSRHDKIEELSREAADFKALAAMAAYVAAKDGSIGSIPADATIEEVTIGVCAGVEAEKTIRQAERGEIPWEKVEKVLNVLFTIACVAAVIALACAGGVGAEALLLKQFGWLQAKEWILGVIRVCVGLLIGTGMKDFALESADSAARSATSGLRRIVETFVRKTSPVIIDAVSGNARTVSEMVRNGVAEPMDETVPEGVNA